ncbi:GDP-mannose 4,6-dehydratase [Chloroflexota bacterium]
MDEDSSTLTNKSDARQKSKNSISRVLITGIAGSCGSYLAEYILKHHPEVEVHGIARWHSGERHNLGTTSDRLTIHESDLMDFSSIFSVLQEIKPDVIFHLAAQANVRLSFSTPSSVMGNNIIGTSNLFEAVRLARLDPIIVLASTSEVYGQVNPKDVPIKEDAPLQPANPYAVSKVAQDLLGWVYFISYKMRIIRARMFTYLNPRRTDLFATSFAKQVAWIERGLQKELVHGNLDSVRTLIDVRDAVRAYWEAALRCRPGEVYNVGGMKTLTVGEFLQHLITLSNVPIPTRCDRDLLRPADVTLQIPCIDKFVRETGWKPIYTFEDSVQNLLSYWRKEADKVVKSKAE